jgi:hypothetical protein
MMLNEFLIAAALTLCNRQELSIANTMCSVTGEDLLEGS